jgi:repressor LexA
MEQVFNELTDRQKGVLNFIIRYIEDNGFPPSIRDIGKECLIKSSSSVDMHLKALRRKGYIEVVSNTPRGIRILRKPGEFSKKVRVAIIGEIAAGKPIFAEQQIDQKFIEVEQGKIPLGKKYYALKVKGDSMIGEDIFDGDIVIISQENTARNGDIVVALIDDEATLKIFQKVGDYIALLPANPLYDPLPIMRQEHNLLIQGRLITTIGKNK